MLGAIVPHGDQAWFFKLVGPTKAVAAESDAFRSLIQSLRFSSGAQPKPTWTLPEAWRNRPGSGIRYATIEIERSRVPLEVSVTVLPKPPTDSEEYALSNINRWREQLGLQALAKQDLAAAVEKVACADGTAVLVDFEGAQPSSAAAPPFASRPNGFPVSTTAGNTPVFDVPKGWRPAANDSVSAVAFELSEGNQAARITVSALPGSGSSLLAQVNRWRAQLNLPAIEASELEQTKATLRIDSLGRDFPYIEMIGPESKERREAILGVVAEVQDMAWFIKLRGDADLAKRQKDDFEAFARSMKLSNSKGASNGN